MGKYNALDVADYIVDKCIGDRCPITNLQLQKILYFLQRYYLQKERDPLFFNEIQAWQFGPVVPDVYYKYCVFGAMPINRTNTKSEIDYADRLLIDPIVEENMSKAPWDLVQETHKPGGAWEIVYDNGRGNHQVISENLIKLRG